jgi:uncharacterized protein YcbX
MSDCCLSLSHFFLPFAMSTPYLKSIILYPIKSLDGVVLDQASVLASGALQHDREFALFDSQGQFVNGKRHAKIHAIRSEFDLKQRQVTLWGPGMERQPFHLDRDRPALESWFSQYFGFPVQVQQNQQAGFPDDTHASGPTIISTQTIETVASWFPDISAEEMRQRIRANLEIGGVPAFWEDQLFSESGWCVQFQIGSVLFEGINPCQRCVVLTRDSHSGTATPQFQKHFVAQRQAALPNWTVAQRFNHFYRLSINTNVPSSQAGQVLQVGDPVTLVARQPSPLS